MFSMLMSAYIRHITHHSGKTFAWKSVASAVYVCDWVYSHCLPTNGRGLWKTATKETQTLTHTQMHTAYKQTDRQTIFIAFGCCFSTISRSLTRLRPVCTHNTRCTHILFMMSVYWAIHLNDDERDETHSAFVCVIHSILFIPIYILIVRGSDVCEHTS